MLLVIHFFAFLQFSESYYPNIWISTPPLLIENTSLTVYFCSDVYFFYYAFDYESMATMRAAIREANASSTWSYTERFLYCYDYECWDLYHENFTNFLVTQHTFSSLLPNTLYSLEFLGCFRGYIFFDSCTVGDSYVSYRVNITTRPAGEQKTLLPIQLHTKLPRMISQITLSLCSSRDMTFCISLSLVPQFQWLTTTQEIQIHFQQDYFTGPAPDGHEVLVWPKNGASHSTATALSHYFPLSTLNATVAGLLPNTEYFLYVRANGTHFANNQGAWVVREVRTRPLRKLFL